MKTEFKISELDKLVETHILPLFSTKSIFTFSGPLGVGKTTMIKSILKKSGVVQSVTSPTFGYVNTFQADGVSFHHFDLYRIGSVEEFKQAGFDEYLHAPSSICLIEWPDVIRDLFLDPSIRQKVCHIKIRYPAINSVNTADFRILELVLTNN